MEAIIYITQTNKIITLGEVETMEHLTTTIYS
jgi:hypothetical protein